MLTPRTMITFKSGEIHFNYRVGGILIQHEHVLCQTASRENFFFLPGGRSELGEAASVSLLREMQEELGVLMEWEKQQPDLVILDTNIMDVDALDLCREMRGTHTALVLVTTTDQNTQIPDIKAPPKVIFRQDSIMKKEH